MKKHYVKPLILAEDLKLSPISTACSVVLDSTEPVDIGDGMNVFGGPIPQCMIDYLNIENGAQLCKNIPAAADVLFNSN